MALRREQFVNNWFDFLNGSITAGATTVNVDDGSALPVDGDVRLRCESEVMLYTGRTVNALTVERGVDGTTAATHADNLRIESVVTRDGIKRYIDDIMGGATARPPARILDKANAILTSSSFSWINQGTASVSDDAQGGIVIKDPQTTGGFRMLDIAAPSTPYTVTAKIYTGPGWTWSTSGTIGGIFFRESSTGEFMLNYYETAEECHVAKYDSATVFNSFLSGENVVDSDSPWVWQQIEDNGTTLFFRVSSDGINFFEMGSEGRTAFMGTGPNRIGFAMNSRGLVDKLMYLKSWSIE